MAKIEAAFVEEFLSLADGAVAQGWHEANAGNLSYRLPPEQIDGISGSFRQGAWEPLGLAVPGIAEQFFFITAAGSYFRDMRADLEHNAGIIELDDAGTHYRVRWGFSEGRRPTSELFMHMLCQEAKMIASRDANRIIYHAHPANVNALTFVLPLTSTAFTRELWTTISECAMVFPRGIGVIDWMVPGSRELAVASAEALEIHDAVVWPHHGIFCAGDTFARAYGLLSTIEKASEVAVKVRSMTTTPLNRISKEDICKINEAYALGIPPERIAAVFQ